MNSIEMNLETWISSYKVYVRIKLKKLRISLKKFKDWGFFNVKKDLMNTLYHEIKFVLISILVLT